MKKYISKSPKLIIGLFIAAFIGIIWLVKADPISKRKNINPAFGAYISAFSPSIIKRNEGFIIKLTKPVTDSIILNNPKGLFSISPSVDGKVEFIDAFTILFKPNELLKRGKEYEIQFFLNKIIKDLPKELNEFEFYTQTVKQAFEVNSTQIIATDPNDYKYVSIKGTFYTADFEEGKLVESLLNIGDKKNSSKIKWNHNIDGQTHEFVLDSIERLNTKYDLLINYNGNDIESDNKGFIKMQIPAIGEFNVLSVNAENSEEQFISIFFSDPIDPNQDFNGLITVNNFEDLRFTVFGNQIRIYSDSKFIGNNTVLINDGILNTIGNKFQTTGSFDANFNNELPNVNLIGKGVIMPDGNKFLFPFEAINLSAIDVKITKVFEQNIPQFLQVNTLDGSNELRRVGIPIVKRKVLLGKNKLTDLNRTNRFAIDLAQVIKAEPGAIYNVEISFKKEYSLYTCSKDTTVNYNLKTPIEDNLETTAVWDETENISEYDEYYYDYDYDWEERDNPCHSSYYSSNRWKTKNVLSSNIALIAKRGSNGMLFISANDIKTTNPIVGANLSILNYQQIEIEKANTDAQGWATVKLNQKPYLLIASYQNQKAYLRLDENTALNLSRFDIGGRPLMRGIKGFLYGERGVWRPGDSLFFNFILEDKGKTLPTDVPVAFELYNPQGQLHRKYINSKNVNGFYNFTTTTDDNAPTGNWLAKVKIGNVVFEKNVRIETVVPNRLKINLTFKDKFLSKGNNLSGTLSSAWLHGALASNFNATIDANFSTSDYAFKGFEKYNFQDETKKLNAESERIFEGQLNADGIANINGVMQAGENAPGILNVSFLTKVFEPGGGFSTDRTNENYFPYNEFIGLKLPDLKNEYDNYEVNTPIKVELACLNKNGTLVNGSTNVNVKVYKIEYRWWWDRSDEDLSDFANSQYNHLVKNENMSIKNGIGNYNFTVNYPEWGRYMVIVTNLKTNHSSAKTFYLDWPNTYSRANRGNEQEATMLSFSTNKKDYKVGEEVAIKIPSSADGRALISIENGTEVVKTYWSTLTKGETEFKFKATKEMLPNAFVHVSLLQPHAQVNNDLPIRLYGIQPINVSDIETVLKPVISSPEVLRPDEVQSIQISEANGKAMTYTLAIVDEGLLDLTRFKTPNPHEDFYAREALGVQTNDLYDFIMNAYSLQMDRILSIGGDEGINKKKKDSKANRFKPVVKFLGPFYLPKGKTENLKFTLPTYYGSIRIMVVAGQNGAYGNAEKAVPVRKPLMMLASLPRVLSINENVKLPISVFAMENDIKNVQVSIECNGLMKVQGRNSKTVTFKKVGEELVDFEINMKALTGIGKIKIKAISGVHKISEEMEIDIRNPNPIITDVTEEIVDANKNIVTSIVPIGFGSKSEAIVEVSSIPPINLSKRLDYLIQYPHGCIEQTTSSVFPQLVLNKLIDLNSNRVQKIEQNIKTGIDKLKNFQTNDGGFAYWPGQNISDEWGSNYAGHFLIEAQKKGYSVPNSLLSNWKKFQKQLAQNYNQTAQQNDIIQAYRLYTLALCGSPEIGAMNRLKENVNINVISKWYLASAYAMVGQKDVAENVIKNLPINVNNYAEMNFSYGSDERDDAIILQTLNLLNKQSFALQKAIQISKNLSSNDWLSTQTTAYCLIAMADYSFSSSKENKLNYNITINGVKQNISTKAFINQNTIGFNNIKPTSINIENNSGKSLFIRIINKGQPFTDKVEDASSNLTMNVQYLDLKGKNINHTNLEQGTDFVCKVELKNNSNLGNYEQMALTTIFPSGWQIQNTRLFGENPLFISSNSQYQDIRDDRVYTYFNIVNGQTLTYYYILNASYLGKFYLPPVNCEAMYNANINARLKGTWVNVVSRKKTNS